MLKIVNVISTTMIFIWTGSDDVNVVTKNVAYDQYIEPF